jgi:PilZ domain
MLPPPPSYTYIIMDEVRPYHRSLYRLPVTYPAMYCLVSMVGEGTITNLSAVGCTIETDEPLPEDQRVALRLLLPDRLESLPIDDAQVRWVNGTRAGVEFLQVQREANLRLHGFVWDQMIERIQTIQQQRSSASS